MSISTAASGSGVSRNLAIVKQYFKKPMTLVVAILSLVTLVSQYMFSSATEKMGDQFAKAIQSMGEGMDQVTVTSGGGNSFEYLISGIITVCLFMIFISSLAPKGGPTIWFTVLHVLSVLELIFTALSALLVVVVEIVFIFSSSTLVTYMVNNDIAGMGSMTEEQIEALGRNVASFRITLLVLLGVTLLIYAIILYYINSQTAFLKSVTLTCRNPQLKSRGAVQYGNISLALGVFQLVCIVIVYLMIGNTDTNAINDMEINFSFDFSPIMKPYLIYSISTALYIVLRGYFAKGWADFAKENEDYVYEAVGASTRHSDASPIATFKSTQRKAQDARQQSQPYLIGEEEDPNKKSSYIPEELQNDYPEQPQPMYGQQGFSDPFAPNPYGNPYQQGGQPPFGGQPGFGGDPFAQSPMGGNPYGGNPYGGNPYDQGGGYNNGMM